MTIQSYLYTIWKCLLIAGYEDSLSFEKVVIITPIYSINSPRSFVIYNRPIRQWILIRFGHFLNLMKDVSFWVTNYLYKLFVLCIKTTSMSLLKKQQQQSNKHVYKSWIWAINSFTTLSLVCFHLNSSSCVFFYIMRNGVKPYFLTAHKHTFLLVNHFATNIVTSYPSLQQQYIIFIPLPWTSWIPVYWTSSRIFFWVTPPPAIITSFPSAISLICLIMSFPSITVLRYCHYYLWNRVRRKYTTRCQNSIHTEFNAFLQCEFFCKKTVFYLCSFHQINSHIYSTMESNTTGNSNSNCRIPQRSGFFDQAMVLLHINGAILVQTSDHNTTTTSKTDTIQ